MPYQGRRQPFLLYVLALEPGDSTVQSINSCLALQHLSDYAHAVVLLDNQALLNTLNSSQHHNTAASSSSSKASSGSVHQYAQKVGTTAQGKYIFLEVFLSLAGQRRACSCMLPPRALASTFWHNFKTDCCVHHNIYSLQDRLLCCTTVHAAAALPTLDMV